MNSGPTRSYVERTNLVLCAGAVGASLAFSTPPFAASVVLGAAVETLNLRALWNRSEFALGLADPRKSSKSAMLGFSTRFVLVGLALWLALASGANPIGLLLGLSLIIPAIVIAAWRRRPQVTDRWLPGLDADDPEWDAWNPWFARERALDAEEEDD